MKDKLLNAKTAEVEIETAAESQPATGSSGSENDASKSEDSRKGFRKRNITAYENKLRYDHVSTVLTDRNRKIAIFLVWMKIFPMTFKPT